MLWPSYLHNGISYTGKTTSSYWFGALVIWEIYTDKTHAGESKRPIGERTPNSWVTERPIDNILIKMPQEAGRCPCLELNN